MKAWNRLTFLSAVFIVCLVGGTFALLYISLVPHFKELGWESLAFLTLLLVCISALAVNWTYNRIKTNNANRRRAERHTDLVTYGDYAIYIPGGNIERMVHVSALHEQARVVQALPEPKKDETTEPWFDEATVIELHESGVGEQSIADSLKTTRHQVRKILSTYEAKQNGRPINGKK